MVPVLEALTVTVTFLVVVPLGLTAESVYVVVTDGVTVTEVLAITPIPLLRLVELALLTLHESIELWPDVMTDGVAISVAIVGADCATLAEQVVVATVDDASVA